MQEAMPGPGGRRRTDLRHAVDLPPLVFGPIPSRRLGRSLGINNIPPKVCSYSCLYCQVGPTMERTIEPRAFHPPADLAAAVIRRVAELRVADEGADHLTFAPDGEPTLDIGIGETLRLLAPLGIPRAVISNASLLWRPEVRERLVEAEWVSVKVDAADEETWRRVARPDPGLDLDTVLEGIRSFVAGRPGTVVSETMLVAGVNDDPDSVARVGGFLRDAGITAGYLSIPTRPTPYPSVTAPDEDVVNRAFQTLSGFVPHLEYLVGYEGDRFAATGDARADLLSITAVHPLRVSAVQRILDRAGSGWELVETLVEDGHLAEVTHRGNRYYVRRWGRLPGDGSAARPVRTAHR